jgi:uncharacterized protein YjbI with pentapeptide repeats
LTSSPDLAAGRRHAELAISGADLSGSRLEGASFLHCRFDAITADAARWRGLSARSTAFRSSRMTGVQLNEAVLRDVLFEDTRLDMANLRLAALERVTFRGCSLEDLDGAGGLAGATIDPVQLMELAPVLARHVGLIVRDD